MAREYKDSGIEWIGRIPKEWKIVPTKRVFGYGKQIAGDNSDNFERLALTMKGVVKRNKDDAEGLQPEKFDGYQILKPNEIVFKLIDLANAKTSRVGLSPYTGIVSPAYIIIRNKLTDNRYHYYWYLFMYYNLIFNHMGDDGVRSALSPEDVMNIPLPYISSPEQRKIADYLDEKCGEIDSLISLQEQMIAQLTDYKQSVITEAVTKGLDPNAQLVPSGIVWIGDIPRGWKVAKAKYFVNINNGSDPLTEGNIPVYGSGASSFKTCGEYKEGPAVLIGRKGATLHIPHYIVGKYWNVDTAFDVKIKHNMELRYYYYLAICFDYKYYISQTTLPGMAQSSYYNMQLPIPPIDEQVAIYTYLDNKCAEIDALISLKQQKIETLKDYKKSLIFEAVTGKIEVV